MTTMDIKLTQVIRGKRYNTQTATLIAHNRYWDGHNHERGGTNLYLYKTPRGAYFTARFSMWQGDDRWRLDPIEPEDAYELYHNLHEHEVEEDEAFNVTIEDA
jgi:hypothetical protein